MSERVHWVKVHDSSYETLALSLCVCVCARAQDALMTGCVTCGGAQLQDEKGLVGDFWDESAPR